MKGQHDNVSYQSNAESIEIVQGLWVVPSTFQIVQILVQSNFELVSSVIALEATEPVSEPVTQMAVELINNQTGRRKGISKGLDETHP